MEFNTYKYTIKEEEDYVSLAKEVLLHNDAYEYVEEDESYLLKEIEIGLKTSLKNKTLKVGETIILIDSVEYYLKVTQTITVGNWNGYNLTVTDSREKEEEPNVNYINKLSRHLFFEIREYKDYKNYYWKEFEPGYELQHGEIGKRGFVDGDKTQYTKVENGYVYLFDKDDKLVFTFVIKSGKYQEVKVTQRDCSHENTVSPERPCGMIYRHYDENGNEKEQYKFVFSEEMLSKARIFGDSGSKIGKLIPSDYCRYAPYSNISISSLNNDTRAGAIILSDLRNSNKSVTISNYNLSSVPFTGYNIGVAFYYANPLKELERRTKIFQKRFEEKERWENTESRVQQLFIYTTIKTMIQKDSSLKRFASMERMDIWNNAYRDESILYSHKVYYGAENLVDWLKSKEFNQCMLNYLSSDNKKSQNYALETYADALKYLFQTRQGNDYAEAELKNPESILNHLYNIDGTKGVSTSNGEVPLAGIILKENWLNQDVISEGQASVRKSEQAILGVISSTSPVLMKFLKAKGFFKTMGRIVDYMHNTKGVLSTTIIKPLENIASTVEVMDTVSLNKAFSSKMNGVKLGQFIAFMEAVNIVVTVKALVSDEENKAKNMACLIGAVMDFSSEVLSNGASRNLMFKVIHKNSWASSAVISGKVVPGLQVISGAIDCFVGMDSAFDAMKHGETGVATGFALYGAGGAITAFGAGLIISGGATATVSLGSLSIPAAALVVGGVVVEAVGLGIVWFWDNKAIKDWIEESIFGDETSLVKDYDLFKKLKSNNEIVSLLNNDNPNEITEDYKIKITSKQIDAINKIMCEFFVEAKFSDTTLGTKVIIEIEPGIITDYAIVKFKNIKAYGFARGAESHAIYSNPYSTITSGNSKEDQAQKQFYKGELDYPDTLVHLEKIHENPLYVEKDANDVIKKIKHEFIFDKDVDKITGEVELDFNNSTLQKLSKPIKEIAASWE
ncbi:hypothetical protein [Saccharicrinis aurantiacus]|uniref:hypothetical protein n=1 Tax=Saccharicrinis aurantiacus TaxID=1849719 RepID=UPI00094FAB8E|nr:hypothetical protein [Saccharicrinis aurantiacus]